MAAWRLTRKKLFSIPFLILIYAISLGLVLIDRGDPGRDDTLGYYACLAVGADNPSLAVKIKYKNNDAAFSAGDGLTTTVVSARYVFPERLCGNIVEGRIAFPSRAPPASA